jgi:serine/threonine protein kinase
MGDSAPVIPGFELVSLLGRGGMGEVWKARQAGIGRWVALKILHSQFSQDPEYVARFLREARTVGKLSHPNIVRAFDCGQTGDQNYLVMEYVEGRPLDRLLKERGAFPEREALALVRAVAEALQHAWEHRVIHRDVKPQNILVTSEGVPRLCDLGLSRDVSEAARLTQSGFLACTPAYASPEQANAEPGIDTRTDVYSLGVVLYELVTGRLPFEAASPTALLLKHVSESPPPPVSRAPHLSSGVNRLILEMLEKSPARRPATPGAVAARLDALLSGKEAPVPKTARLPGPRRPRGLGSRRPASAAGWVIGGSVAAAIFVIAALALSGGRPSPPPRPARLPQPMGRAADPPTDPPPRRDPAPPPRPPEPSPSEGRAPAARAALRAFCAAHSDDLPAQIREYQKTLLEMAGSPLAAETERELRDLRARREAELDRARADADTRARSAAAQEEFGRAIEIHRGAARRHPDAPWAAGIEAKVGEIRKQAEALWAALRPKTEEAARKGDAAELKSLRDRVAAWGIPDLLASLDQAVAAAPRPARENPPPPTPPPPPPPPAAGRPKPPDGAEQREIRARVKSLFRDDYAKKTPEEVRALSKKLYEAARRSGNDASTKYVLLEEARDQGIRCGDASATFAALDALLAEYEVDARRIWPDALRQLSQSAREPAAAAAFVSECVARARQAATADDYDLAGEFLKHAEPAVRRAGDASAAASFLEAQARFRRAQTAFRAAQGAFRKLETDPADDAAHLEVGRYLCFGKGDWTRGLEHLARGTDLYLRKAAELERTAAADPTRLADAADAWRAYPSRSVDVRESIEEHAVDLYRAAWPGLAGARRDPVRDHLLRAAVREGPAGDAPPAEWFIGTGTRRDLYRLDRSRARAGKGSLRVDPGGSQGWMSVGYFPVLEDQEFEFSAWILTDRADAWDLCNVYFYDQANGRILDGFHLRAPADQPWWTPLRTRLKAPKGSKAFQVMVTCGFPKGAMWVDDLSLRELPSGKEWVANGAFER